MTPPRVDRNGWHGFFFNEFSWTIFNQRGHQEKIMRLLNGQRLYSASDVANFLECSHLTNLDDKALAGELKRTGEDEYAALIKQRGHRHERGYLDQLQAEGVEVVTVPDADFDAQVAATRETQRGRPLQGCSSRISRRSSAA